MANEPERLQAAALDPNFSDPAVYGPTRPAEAPTQLSVLDMLRKRMSREMENEDQRRLSDLGTALLASRSPNFLTALGEGFAAQQAGSASRMDRLRQLAEAERQQRALESQEAAQRADADYRQESLRLRREEAARAGQVVGVPFLNDQGRVVLVNPRTGEPIRETNLRPLQELRNQPRPLSQADIAAISQRALARANTDVGILPGVAPTPAQITRRDELQRQYLAEDLERARQGLSGTPQTGGSGAPAAPAAIIDLRANPGGNPPR